MTISGGASPPPRPTTRSNPSLTLFIHGLDSDRAQAVRDTATIGANFAGTGIYGHLVIGFSRPSMGGRDLIDYASGYPQPAQSGAARGNITLSVTVYYASNDNTLALSESAFSAELGFPLSMDSGRYHNPAFFGRLGLSGPSHDQGPQASNMFGIDCSAVVNQAYVAQLPPSVYPAGSTLHSSYIVIPQVVHDIAATLAGTAPGSVANRTPLLNAGPYFMSTE